MGIFRNKFLYYWAHCSIRAQHTFAWKLQSALSVHSHLDLQYTKPISLYIYKCNLSTIIRYILQMFFFDLKPNPKSMQFFQFSMSSMFSQIRTFTFSKKKNNDFKGNKK